MSETQAPVAGADPRAWREMARSCEAKRDAMRSLSESALSTGTSLLAGDTSDLLHSAAAALRDAAEAVTEAQAKATEYRGHLRYEVERRQELERAVAGLRAQIETGPAFDAAARGAEGEALRSIVRDAFREGYTQGRYHSPGKSVRCEAERIGLAYVERVSDSLDTLAPRPSDGPAGGVSAEVAIVVALARCGMGANPTAAVRHQIQRLAAAWRAAGREGEAARLDAVLAPAPDELRGVRLVQSQEVGDAPAARASDDPARDAERYRTLRRLALGDECEPWDRLYALVDDATPNAAALFDAAVDALTPRPSAGPAGAVREYPPSDSEIADTNLADLVARFSAALLAKLRDAEARYGWSDGWTQPSNVDGMREAMVRHIAKGDPRDVAAYCAFLWHHGASTAAPAPAAPSPEVEHG